MQFQFGEKLEEELETKDTMFNKYFLLLLFPILLSVVFLGNQDAFALDKANHLRAYYSFNETGNVVHNATNLIDLSTAAGSLVGLGANGRIQQSAGTYGGFTGVIGTAYSFPAEDFDNQANSTNSFNWLHNGQTNWSASFWLLNDDSGQFAQNTTVFTTQSGNTNKWTRGITIKEAQGDGSTKDFMELIIGNGNGIVFDKTVTGSVPTSHTNWEHFVITFTPSTKTMQLYGNGSLLATVSNNTLGGFTTGNGDRKPALPDINNQNAFENDEFSFWDTILTQPDVTLLYNNTHGYNLLRGSGIPPGTVDQSANDPRLDSGGEQRVSYFDGTRNWVFYYNSTGPNIVYRSSSDGGGSWSSPASTGSGALPPNSYFGVWGNGTNRVVVTWANTTKVLTKAGTITGTSISWASPVGVSPRTLASTGAGTNYYPTFEKVGSNLLLGFNVMNNTINEQRVYKSTNEGNSWSYGTTFSVIETKPAFIGVAKYGNTKAIAMVAKYNDSDFQYRTFDGSTWSSGVYTSNTNFTKNALKTNAVSVTSNGTCAWIGYVPNNIGGILQSRTFCGSFSSPTIVQSNNIAQDATASFGLSTWSGRQIQAEYVNSSSVLVGKQINTIMVQLKRVGSPTGNATVGIFNGDLSVKKSFGTMDVSTIFTSYRTYIFSLSVSSQPYTIQSGDRIGIKYTGGDSTNQVNIMTDQVGTFDGSNSYLTYYTTSWKNFTSNDLYFTFAQSAVGANPTISAIGNDIHLFSVNATNNVISRIINIGGTWGQFVSPLGTTFSSPTYPHAEKYGYGGHHVPVVWREGTSSPFTVKSTVTNLEWQSSNGYLVSNPGKGNQNEDSVTIYPLSIQTLFDNFFNATGNDFFCHVFNSTDGGISWSSQYTIPVTTDGADQGSDPVLTASKNGTLYASCMSFHGFSNGTSSPNDIVIAKYSTSSHRWSLLPTPVQTSRLFSQDKEWIAADRSSNSTTQNNLYLTWANFTNPVVNINEIKFKRIQPADSSYQVLVNGTFNQLRGPTIAIGPQGQVYVAYENYSSGEIDLKRSYNAGVAGSWIKQIVKVGNFTLYPTYASLGNGEGLKGWQTDKPFRAAHLPSMDVDLNGVIRITYETYNGSYGGDILYSQSTNCKTGNSATDPCTFSPPVKINLDNTFTDQFQPQLVISAKTSPTVHVVAYDRRDDSSNRLWIPYDYHCSIAVDCTKIGNWTNSKIVNVQNSNFDGGDIVGDYHGLGSSSILEAYPTWTADIDPLNPGNYDIYGDRSRP